MSLISKLQLLGSEQIMNELKLSYGHDFPIEIRLHMAEFLERRLVNVNESQLNVDEVAKAFIGKFLVEIERKTSELKEDDPAYSRLLELHRNLKADAYATRIYSHLMNCVVFEQQLLYKATHTVDSAFDQVTQSVYHLDDLVRRNEGLKAAMIRRCHGYQEDYQKVYREYYNSISDTINHELCEFAGVVYSMGMDELRIKLDTLVADCNTIAQNVNTVTNIAHDLVCRVIDDFLKQWQWKSKVNGVNIVVNGATLDNIQSWCERLAMCLWTTMEQVRVVLEMTNADEPRLKHFVHTFINLNHTLTPILFKLVHDSFIVEHQPSQIIHSQRKFAVGVRLLIGKSLGQHFANSEVNVELLTENQAKAVVGSMDPVLDQPRNKVANNISYLEFSETQNKMTGTFRNMSLVKYSRFDKKQSDSVLDEKSTLCFHATINVGELSFNIKKLSVPFVIIVSTSQEIRAKATIFWDNFFGHIDRMPFAVPDQVTWSQLADALNKEMISYGGRGLSEQNFRFLFEKLLRSQPVNANDLVSFSRFCKEKLPDQNFTFWHWFHSALNLTQDCLEPWKDGSIVGFISKTEAGRILSESAEGTFLLRFSENSAGTISIAVNLRNPYSDIISVFHLQPFDHEQFANRSLLKILNDLKPLTFLYPNTAKADAFGRYEPGLLLRRNTESPLDGYVRMSAKFELVWECHGNGLYFTSNEKGNVQKSR